ncbi:MAG: L-threo-3-hydroxyaspartate ammonia-lyase [Ignavibacteriaceae bacterium]|nr:L-threo-3-hydroxyaspartate ammonia-lyase [Ignavibacteriaceae bacterium]
MLIDPKQHLPCFPSAEDITRAHERIAPNIHRTPVLTSRSLNEIAGAELFFKCENFQRGGAFKIRGAFNAALNLPHELLRNGIATHSSGNHATAVSIVAAILGIPAFVVMPTTSKKIKIKSVEAFGGKIIFCEPTLEARQNTLEKVVAETGASFIHPYDNLNVITGQATAAKELIESVPSLDSIIAPVGGGGLLSGTALSAAYFGKRDLDNRGKLPLEDAASGDFSDKEKSVGRPTQEEYSGELYQKLGSIPNSTVNVYGAEPSGADDAFRSLKAGKILPSVNPATLADGLLTSLGVNTFPIIKTFVTEIITVTDSDIIAAMKLIYERLKIVIEPSSATVLAALLQEKVTFAGKKVGLILSGGNVDLTDFGWIFFKEI